jgi:hypothetical protein
MIQHFSLQFVKSVAVVLTVLGPSWRLGQFLGQQSLLNEICRALRWHSVQPSHVSFAVTQLLFQFVQQHPRVTPMLSGFLQFSIVFALAKLFPAPIFWHTDGRIGRSNCESCQWGVGVLGEAGV